MKNKITFSIIILLLGISFSASAKKWRVNKSLPLNQVDFHQLWDAVEVASAGDTIYVEGINGVYDGDINIKKKLIIIGPGYFLNDPDLHPTLCDHLPARIAGLEPITIDGTSGNVSGTVITGLTFDGTSSAIQIKNATDINITRNRINGRILFPNDNNSSNISITRNIIRWEISCGIEVFINELNIANNLILGDIDMHPSSEINTSTVRNNTFKETSEISMGGSIISFNYVGSIDCTPINTIVANNRFNTFNDCYLNVNGNIQNSYAGDFDMDQDSWVFDNPSDSTTTHGAYNGNDPYYNDNPISPANLPAWPVIYDCDIISDGDSTLQVIFDVRSND